MYTIKENTISEITIKNSKFITLIVKINQMEDIYTQLEEIKNEYPKATHYCYAYILENTKGKSDDGEPGGTAGSPILNVLEKEKIMNVLCVVIRYFGGVKLGAGGLVRAYSKSCKETLLVAKKLELVYGYKVEITFSYEKQKEIDYLLKDNIILDKQFLENIIYIILIEDIEIIKSFDYKILSKEAIEKV